MRALVLFFVFSGWSVSLSAAPYYEGVGCNAEGRNCVFGVPTHRVLEWKVRGSRLDLGAKCESFYQRLTEGLNKIEEANDLKGNFTFENFIATTLVDPVTEKPHSIECQIEIHSTREDVLVKGAVTKHRTWILQELEAKARDNCFSASTKAQNEKCNRDLKAVCNEDLAEIEADPLGTYPMTGLSASLLQGDMCFVRHIRVEFKKPAANPADGPEQVFGGR
ncbi:MAG: hypothetical protein H6624_06040 [Bdellovibrionaceae bacterium]|nr:hypothetical protein [Bdellovibrionales bacterium]MCB9083883.1 hypothetical protein [Pseudobdellovibrionaceae bacterium]